MRKFDSQEDADRFFKTFNTIMKYYEKDFDNRIKEATIYQKLIIKFDVIPAYNPSTNEVVSQFKSSAELKRMAKKLKEPYDIGF